MIIADNDLSQEAGFFYTAGGEIHQRGENAIDVKISSTSSHPDSVVKIKRNQMRHYYPPVADSCLSGQTNSFVCVALGHANNLEFDSNLIDDVHVGIALAYPAVNLKIRGNIFNNVTRKATTHDPQQDGAALLLHVDENKVLIEGNIMRNCMRNVAFFNEQYSIDTSIINIKNNIYEGELLHFYNETSPPGAIKNIYRNRNILYRKPKSISIESD